MTPIIGVMMAALTFLATFGAVWWLSRGIMPPFGLQWVPASREQPSQAWQPIETAPKDGTPLLLFAGAYLDGHEYAPTIVVGWYVASKGWIANSYRGQITVNLRPKAWMSLPRFPETMGRCR